MHAPSSSTERHIFQQQIQILDGPPRVLPGPLLHLVLPVGIDAPALDPPAAPPLLIRQCRRRQRLAKQLLDAPKAECDLLLPARQASQKLVQRSVLGHSTNDGSLPAPPFRMLSSRQEGFTVSPGPGQWSLL